MRTFKLAPLVLAAFAAGLSPALADASSHREIPPIWGDAAASAELHPWVEGALSVVRAVASHYSAAFSAQAAEGDFFARMSTLPGA